MTVQKLAVRKNRVIKNAEPASKFWSLDICKSTVGKITAVEFFTGKIHVGKIDDFARCGFSKLSVILTENPDYEKSKRSGIPDNEFIFLELYFY